MPRAVARGDGGRKDVLADRGHRLPGRRPARKVRRARERRDEHLPGRHERPVPESQEALRLAMSRVLALGLMISAALSSCARSASPPAASETSKTSFADAGFVNRVWKVSKSNAVTTGQL